MTDIARLVIEVSSNGAITAAKRLDQVEKSGKRAASATDAMTKRMEQMGRTMGRMAALGVTAMAGLTANSLRLAVAAEETASKFQVVFRGSVERANAQLVQMSKTIPLTITQMRGLASGVQDMLVPMGLVRDEAANLSVTAVQLAGDIASFNDTDADVVLQNIQSALAGSSEPLRKFGIDVREARLESIALEKGLIGVGDELDSASRAQAVFAAITEDSADAMGDAERTIDSTANQLRFMRRNFVQAQEDLGTLLIPAFNDLLTIINQVDDDGMTPLMRTMQVISAAILQTTKFVLLLTAGWLQLKNAIIDVANIIPDLDFKQAISAPGAPIAGFAQNLGFQIRQQFEETREERAKLDAETAASLEGLFSTIAGIDLALAQLSQGVTRTLEDTRNGMEETAGAAGEMGKAFDSEAFGRLLDEIDPLSKEMRELAAARKLLDQAFASGKIDASEFERLNILLDQMFDNMQQLATADFSVMSQLEDSFAFVERLEANADALDRFRGMVDPAVAKYNELGAAIEQLNKIREENPELFEDGEFDRLVAGLERVIIAADGIGEAIMQSADIARDVFRDLQKGLGRESEYFDALTVAIEATNLAKAIGAVLAQGQGEPYTAPMRMAAMAAIVSALVGTSISIGNLGGGSADISATRQESQGTGSVLGDTTAKTESILRASEITADATSELVGINRGMLHALMRLQDGIEGAVIQLARGAGNVDFGALPSTFNTTLLHGDFLGGSLLGKLIDSVFGGKSELVDEGINILGGAIDEIVIQAFRSVEVKKHIFDDTDLEESFQDLGEDVNNQFRMVFESIEDTVREAALALGIPLDEINARIESFEVASQRISLKDLTADEQRDELLAVFGEIFDDLAVHVVPYIEQFQQVGEGLGETLVRVATSIQVFQEAFETLGFAADMSDPEAVAQMAVGLVELTGGVETFIAQFSTFMDKFASDEQKLAFATEQLNSAFEQAGLTVPTTSEGMWELMQSLDATTEEGREQIATILRLADVAAEYYDLIERAEEDRLRQAQILEQQVQLVADYIGGGASSELRALVNRFEDAMDAADALGASTREYAMILRSFDRQLQRMAAELTLRIISLTQQLFGSQVQDGITAPIAAGVEETREIANSLFTDWQRALSNLREFTQSILLNEELTTLTPAERLAEAQAQFDALLAAALGGDVEAAAALPDAARELLEVARFMFASGAEYQHIFDSVLAALNSVQMPANIPETIVEVIGGGSSGELIIPETVLDQVAEALQRTLMAMDLAEALRDLSLVTGQSVLQLAEELGIPLNELVELLGVELGTLTEETATSLASAAELMGANVLELVDALGIGLEELARASGVSIDNMSQDMVEELRAFADSLGVSILELSDALGLSVEDMAETFGVSIENFEAAHFQALAEFSEAMGLTISETTEALGISLGEISDATSLLSQSLDLAIAELPSAIQADLGPMLDAIRMATTQADANLAIQNLGNYVLGLPPDIAAALMPFLELIGFQEQTPELTALQQIEANTRAMVSAIASIGNIQINIPEVVTTPGGTASGAPSNPSVIPGQTSGVTIGAPNVLGSYATGGPIDQTGLYQLHEGEYVVNATRSNLQIAANTGGQSDPPQRIVDELAQIRAALRSFQEQSQTNHAEDIRTARGIQAGVTEQNERSRRRAGGCG